MTKNAKRPATNNFKYNNAVAVLSNGHDAIVSLSSVLKELIQTPGWSGRLSDPPVAAITVIRALDSIAGHSLNIVKASRQFCRVDNRPEWRSNPLAQQMDAQQEKLKAALDNCCHLISAHLGMKDDYYGYVFARFGDQVAALKATSKAFSSSLDGLRYIAVQFKD